MVIWRFILYFNIFSLDYFITTKFTTINRLHSRSKFFLKVGISLFRTQDRRKVFIHETTDDCFLKRLGTVLKVSVTICVFGWGTSADRMEKVTQKDRREKVERTTLASKRVQRSINYVGSRLERDKTKISKIKTFFQKW